MTETFFYGFAIGAVTAFFVGTIFFSVKYHELYEQLQESLNHNRQQAEAITDLKANQHQVIWDDERLPTYREMTRQHPELVQPGQEIIRIDTLDDIPDYNSELIKHVLDTAIIPTGWRGKTGQGGET